MSPNEIVSYLRTPRAIRERCQAVVRLIENGDSDNFHYNPSKLEYASELTLAEIKSNYPDLKVPYHSRWRHFEVGGIDRAADLAKQISSDKRELAMAKLELAIVSVLLDAGAGNTWKYQSDKTYSRSEGLAVASFDGFMSGAFSSAGKSAHCASGAGLSKIDAAAIERMFKVNKENPLLGVEGRAKLLQGLGSVISSYPDVFVNSRLGDLLGVVENRAKSNQIASGDLLSIVLEFLSSIWPGRVSIAGTNLGDVWKHSKLTSDPYQGMIPFHKLSQWLTYSLIEPIEEFGIRVVAMDQLTGLPEYRNGGLLVDCGVLTLKNPKIAEISHQVDSDLVIEWRAATVISLDRIAQIVRAKLNKSEEEFPLAKVLQGGTWTAGRKIAAQLRADGTPPLKIISDGTVF